MGLALGLLASGPVLAEIIILDSNTSAYKSGQIMSDNSRLKIPSGKTVQLILPSGATKTLKGPFDGNLSSIAKSEGSNSGLFKRLLEVVKKSKKDDTGFGAVRRVGSPSAMALEKFSWTSIPANAKGSFCFAEGEPLNILRPRNLSQDKVTLRDTASNKTATISWNAGKKSANWPDDILPKDKSRFGFKLTDTAERTIMFRMVERGMLDGENILKTLYRRGCEGQLEAWLRQRLRR